MSEKGEVNTNRDFCKTPEQLRQQLSGMSEPEIMQMLSDWTECAHRSGEELPPELVMTFYDVLDEVAPLEPMPFDFQASWKRFTKEHPELIPQENGADTGKKRWVRSRKLKYLISLATATLMIISVYAMDMPTVVYFWGQDVLQIRPTSGTMNFTEKNDEGYSSLTDVLNANAVDAAIPTWIPDNYYLEEISVQTDNGIFYCTASYISSTLNKRPILIRVIAYSDMESIPDINYERNVDERHQSVSFNGYTVMLTSNNAFKRANWISGNCSVSVSGELSALEIKQILHSIE